MTTIKHYAADPLAFFDALVIPSALGAMPFADVMADYQRDWFTAIAPSLLAVAAGEQPPITRWFLTRTKGASKDSDISCVLLWLLAFSRHKLDMQVGAADRDQALELKKAAADILRLNEWLSKRIEAQAWSLLCKATGSECNIIASDVAGSHGSRPDIVVMNELSHVTKEEFSQNLLDNATKKPKGLVIVATNAGFVNTWQHRWQKIAQQSDRWHFHEFAQPAPWLGDDELDEAKRRNSSSRFRRLFWGDWVSASGDALDEADILASIDDSLGPMRGMEQGYYFVGALDLGLRHDHSGLIAIAVNRTTQKLRLAYAKSWKPDPITKSVNLITVEREVLEAHQRFGFATVGFDPWQAALLAQRLELQGVPMKEVPFVGKNLTEMATTLLDVFRSRRIALYDHPALIIDLGKLQIEEKSYGHRLSATRDESGHADLATALAIALPLATDQMGKQPVRVGAIDLGTSPLEPWIRRRLQFGREIQKLQGGGDRQEFASNLDLITHQ